jgi:hypothetical protein
MAPKKVTNNKSKPRYVRKRREAMNKFIRDDILIYRQVYFDVIKEHKFDCTLDRQYQKLIDTFDALYIWEPYYEIQFDFCYDL